MDVQVFGSKDINSLSELQPEGWSDIMPPFIFYTSASFCFPIKVIINNKIVGIGTSIIHNDIGWLAHIIVHSEYRNKGIGSIITQTLIDDLKAKGLNTIFLNATNLGGLYIQRQVLKQKQNIYFLKI